MSRAEQARQRMLLEGRIGRAAADAAEQQPNPEARQRREVLADGGKLDIEDGLNCHTHSCISVSRNAWAGGVRADNPMDPKDQATAQENRD